MKLRLIALLSLITTTSLIAQMKRDSTGTPKDSLKLAPVEITNEKAARKSKKLKQVDTTSYAKEYNRNSVGFQWGARGGINLNRFTTKEIMAISRVNPVSGTPVLVNNHAVNDNILSNEEMIMGYLGGFFIRMTRGPFFIQPEIFYARKGGKLDILQSDGKLFKRVNATYSVVDVPLLLGIRFRQARIFAGPMFEFPISFNDELLSAVKTYKVNNDQNTQIDFKKELFKRPSVGVSAGLGFEFNHFFIEGRFEILNPINYNISYNNDPLKNLQISTRALVLSIGFIK